MTTTRSRSQPAISKREIPLAADMPIEVERRVIERYRELTPAQKIRRVGELRQLGMSLAIAHLRTQHPTASRRELRLRWASRLLDRATMIRAYGWDPEAHPS